MRNYDARMTGEVDKRFQGQRRTRSVLPKIRSVIAAACGVVCHLFGNSADAASRSPTKCIRQQFRAGFTCARYHGKARACNACQWKWQH